MFVEEAFNIAVDDGEIGPENLDSVRPLAKHVRRKVEGTPELVLADRFLQNKSQHKNTETLYCLILQRDLDIIVSRLDLRAGFERSRYLPIGSWRAPSSPDCGRSHCSVTWDTGVYYPIADWACNKIAFC
jgi:hypothetical protein